MGRPSYGTVCRRLDSGERRCRYLGLARYAVQSYLTAMALNLKRLVKLLFGVGFRNPRSCLQSRLTEAQSAL